MDSLEENANTQTIQQPAIVEEKLTIVDAPKQPKAPASKPDKPKQTYKCLVCGKS
jgi:hypothetical protein